MGLRGLLSWVDRVMVDVHNEESTGYRGDVTYMD